MRELNFLLSTIFFLKPFFFWKKTLFPSQILLWIWKTKNFFDPSFKIFIYFFQPSFKLLLSLFWASFNLLSTFFHLQSHYYHYYYTSFWTSTIEGLALSIIELVHLQEYINRVLCNQTHPRETYQCTEVKDLDNIDLIIVFLFVETKYLKLLWDAFAEIIYWYGLWGQKLQFQNPKLRFSLHPNIFCIVISK